MERQGPVAEELVEESSALLLCCNWFFSQAGGKVVVRGRRGRRVVVVFVVVWREGLGKGGLRGLVQGCWPWYGEVFWNWRPEGGVGR